MRGARPLLHGLHLTPFLRFPTYAVGFQPFNETITGGDIKGVPWPPKAVIVKSGRIGVPRDKKNTLTIAFSRLHVPFKVNSKMAIPLTKTQSISAISFFRASDWYSKYDVLENMLTLFFIFFSILLINGWIGHDGQ